MKIRQVFTFKGITRRWIFNSMGIIVAILAIVWIVLALAVHSYYYGTVRSYLLTEARVCSTQFTRDMDQQTPDFYATAKEFVDGFSDKNNVELLIFDKKGDILLTSSDFLPDQKLSMPDFTQAQTSSQGIGSWMGVNAPTGEKVMAVTCVLRDSQGRELGAARYVVSLTQVDWQIALLSLISGIICIAIIFFVLFSGMYFVNSIVVPVREVTAMAGRIASGDYNARISKSYDDEIGELCDTINNLAGELGTTDRIKNDFISSVSHELRTPLTAIKGWSETVLGCTPNDRDTIEKGMRVIMEETGRLSSMVEDLLDFSRMQNGRFRMAIDKIDILAELGEAVLMFSDRARREGMTLLYDEPEYLPPLMGDRNRLRQVFVNILDNAFKYSKEGDAIKVEAINNGNHIKIIIRDTGCGIPQRDLPHVKRKFYKGNLTQRGSGIGLAVADEIVCLHGGTLGIESEENQGTTVTIILPTVHNQEAVQS